MSTQPTDLNDDEPVAVDAIQGANPFVGLTPGQIAQALGRWGTALVRRPTILASQTFGWAGEELRVIAGVSKIAPDAKDRRFTDSAWRSPGWRRLKQSYLVTRKTVLDSVDSLELDEKSAARARFALSQVTEAAAPTNNMLLNPAALKRVIDSRGRSVIDGSRNMLHDLRHNGGLPTQVDTRPFRLGETIALSPGAVVHRTALFELIQYAPATDKVAELPTLVVPPQINRFYFLDMAPGRSFVEHAVNERVQTFMISWRNPGPEHRDWGIDDYTSAVIEAMEVAARIANVEQVNVMGFCAGGMTLACALSFLTTTGSNLVNAATLAVTLLDSRVSSQLNVFASQRTIEAAIAKSSRKGVLEGRSLSRVFSFMRPNDLVWNYWVSNYLLGETPPAFDVLAWNADATNLPATLHAEFIHLWIDNCLMTPGALTVLDQPVDLGAVKNEVYLVGAITDHLVPWQSVYGATRAFGGLARFVLANSGHIQALISPPSNPKASWFDNENLESDADEWHRDAVKVDGSWWVDWARWTIERSGDLRAKPSHLGHPEHEVIEEAPGRYVRE